VARQLIEVASELGGHQYSEILVARLFRDVVRCGDAHLVSLKKPLLSLISGPLDLPAEADDELAQPILPSHPSTFSVENGRYPGDGMIQVVIYDRVVVLANGGEFLVGPIESALHREAIFGAPPLEPANQLPAGRRQDEHLDRTGHRLSDLASAFDFDVEHRVLPGREDPVDLGPQRPV